MSQLSEAYTYAHALHEALSQTEAKFHDQIIENLITMLQTEQKVSLYVEIVKIYEQDFVHNKKEITLTTAVPLENQPELIENLHSALGTDETFKRKIDSSIIGGVIVQVGDQQLDASLRGKLQQLKSQLIR